MRTVVIDNDHVAQYERVAKGSYRFNILHATTGRELLSGACDTPKGASPASVEAIVRGSAAGLLSQDRSKRRRAAAAFSAGKPVPSAPLIPSAAHSGSQISPNLNISADLPVRIIRDAFRRVPMVPGESTDSWRSRCTHAALDAGHNVLIGAPDDVILGIARGELTLTGSMREGVSIVRVAA